MTTESPVILRYQGLTEGSLYLLNTEFIYSRTSLMMCLNPKINLCNEISLHDYDYMYPRMPMPQWRHMFETPLMFLGISKFNVYTCSHARPVDRAVCPQMECREPKLFARFLWDKDLVYVLLHSTSYLSSYLKPLGEQIK